MSGPLASSIRMTYPGSVPHVRVWPGCARRVSKGSRSVKPFGKLLQFHVNENDVGKSSEDVGKYHAVDVMPYEFSISSSACPLVISVDDEERARSLESASKQPLYDTNLSSLSSMDTEDYVNSHRQG